MTNCIVYIGWQTKRIECSIEQPIEKIRGRHQQIRGGQSSIRQSLELVKHRDKNLNVTGKKVLNLLSSVRNIDCNMMQHISNVIKLYARARSTWLSGDDSNRLYKTQWMHVKCQSIAPPQKNHRDQ